MNSIMLIAIYVACELIANITASRPVSVGPLVVPGGVFIYAMTFTLVDLINERLGKQRARQVVFGAFAASFLLALYSLFVIALPSPSYFRGNPAFAQVLGATPRIVGAGLLAYLASSLVDVEIFAWWREQFGRYKWARVIASNSVSTFLDSAIFCTAAFIGIMPVVPLILGQYLMKMAVTVLSVPLIYAVHPTGRWDAKASIGIEVFDGE